MTNLCVATAAITVISQPHVFDHVVYRLTSKELPYICHFILQTNSQALKDRMQAQGQDGEKVSDGTGLVVNFDSVIKGLILRPDIDPSRDWSLFLSPGSLAGD